VFADFDDVSAYTVLPVFRTATKRCGAKRVEDIHFSDWFDNHGKPFNVIPANRRDALFESIGADECTGIIEDVAFGFGPVGSENQVFRPLLQDGTDFPLREIHQPQIVFHPRPV
jgi:hypothetical protein